MTLQFGEEKDSLEIVDRKIIDHQEPEGHIYSLGSIFACLFLYHCCSFYCIRVEPRPYMLAQVSHTVTLS